MKEGTLVKVTVDRPDGCSENVYTKGEIGVISRIEHHVTFGTDYTVHNRYGDYIYGIDQFRELTDDECRDALRMELMR